MSFDVGEVEHHQVVFTFTKSWGGLTITVDGVNVVRSVRLASLNLVKTYDFVVGEQEKHHIRIEKHRKQFFAGFRPQPVYAYVDGHLVAQSVA